MKFFRLNALVVIAAVANMNVLLLCELNFVPNHHTLLICVISSNVFKLFVWSNNNTHLVNYEIIQ